MGSRRRAPRYELQGVVSLFLCPCTASPCRTTDKVLLYSFVASLILATARQTAQLLSSAASSKYKPRQHNTMGNLLQFHRCGPKGEEAEQTVRTGNYHKLSRQTFLLNPEIQNPKKAIKPKVTRNLLQTPTTPTWLGRARRRSHVRDNAGARPGVADLQRRKHYRAFMTRMLRASRAQNPTTK